METRYYQFMAERLAGMDGKAFASVFKETTGETLDAWAEIQVTRKPRKGNLQFRNFKLIRFRQHAIAIYMGKIPAHDSHPTQVYEIKCIRSESGVASAQAFRDGAFLFGITANSFSRVQHLAVSALHAYIERSRHGHRKGKGKAEVAG